MDNQSIDPRNQNPADFFKQAQNLSLAPGNARRWLARVIGKGECDLLECGRLGILPRRFIEKTNALPRLRLEKKLVSAASNFQKLAFRTQDDLIVESVLIPLQRPDAVSVCLSSQIGCIMRCAYCATGMMQTQRNLETWEIVDQLIQARAIARTAGKRVTGAVPGL